MGIRQREGNVLIEAAFFAEAFVRRSGCSTSYIAYGHRTHAGRAGSRH